MDLLGVMDISVERTWKVSSGEVKLRGMAQDTSLALPFPALIFHITHDFCDYDLMPSSNISAQPLNGAPQKCFQSGPALVKAGSA